MHVELRNNFIESFDVYKIDFFIEVVDVIYKTIYTIIRCM